MQQERLRKILPEYLHERKPGPSPMKQRPMQTVMRRKVVPKMDAPAKSEPKVIASESKVVKGPFKPPDTNSAGSFRKAEIKKQEVDKPAPKPAPAPVESRHGGHYELNARMTKMVENELRDIMIKVWQELPDNPTDEAECLVVDKLRNNAGDDLRNVLGLNITKRLLNVHNPLYVKVQFSGKPEKIHLGEFLKKYNFIAFKRIEKTVNMFAAQVKTITDFDRICSASDIRCGDIKVTVNPIYRFTKCPPNLITSFKNEDDASDDTTEMTEKDEKTEDKAGKIPTPEKVSKQTESVPSKPNLGASKTEHAEKLESLSIVESKSAEGKTATVNKPAPEKIAPIINPAQNKAPLNKTSVENKSPVGKKVAITKPALENNAGVKKPTVENKNTANKVTVNKPAVEKSVTKATAEKSVPKPEVEKSVPKPEVEKKIVFNKPSVDTPVFNKPVQNKTAPNKPAVVNKNDLNKSSEEKAEVKKLQTNIINKDKTKKPGPSPVKAQVKTEETNKPESDYDELDDHDILALMSEGIILDECSGSDDE